MQACIDGSIEIVTFLLEHGADVNQVDSEGWTPLHVASSCGYADIAECVGVSFKQLNQCSTLLFATVLNVREHRGCQSISALHNADIVVICAEITLHPARVVQHSNTSSLRDLKMDLLFLFLNRLSLWRANVMVVS